MLREALFCMMPCCWCVLEVASMRPPLQLLSSMPMISIAILGSSACMAQGLALHAA